MTTLIAPAWQSFLKARVRQSDQRLHDEFWTCLLHLKILKS